eukprot:366095-Chlamydomonas_euryale.AAC.4
MCAWAPSVHKSPYPHSRALSWAPTHILERIPHTGWPGTGPASDHPSRGIVHQTARLSMTAGCVP